MSISSCFCLASETVANDLASFQLVIDSAHQLLFQDRFSCPLMIKAAGMIFWQPMALTVSGAALAGKVCQQELRLTAGAATSLLFFLGNLS